MTEHRLGLCYDQKHVANNTLLNCEEFEEQTGEKSVRLLN